MKKLRFRTGGRPRANNDLQTLQDEVDYAITGQFLGLPACVVFGCEIVPQPNGKFNVGHGLLYMEAGIHRFDGVANVDLPAELYLAAEVLSDLRPYQTGGSDYCMSERKVMARSVAGTGSRLLVTPDGILHFTKAREASFRSVGEMTMLADVAAEWDNTGKGKYGTKSYGWALCNGLNGTPNMEGMFPVGFGGSGDYAVTRRTGGLASVRLTANQNGQHTHQMDQAGAHSHSYQDRFTVERDAIDAGSNTRRDQDRTETKNTGSAGSHVHTIQESGLGEAHENRPPFMVVAYRMWIGI
jgi:microcystin-dependent protein